jgi:hypothetical protein
MRVTFLFEVRHDPEIAFVANPEHMFPTEHGEKRFVASIVVGFI